MHNVINIVIGAIMTKLRRRKRESKRLMTENTQKIITYHPEQENENLDHNYCLRCGRKLKNPEYRKIGYGPICYEKIREKNKHRLF